MIHTLERANDAEVDGFEIVQEIEIVNGVMEIPSGLPNGLYRIVFHDGASYGISLANIVISSNSEPC